MLRISLPKKKMLVLPHPRCDVVCDLCVWYRVSVMGEWLTPVYVVQVGDAEDIRVQKKAMSPTKCNDSIKNLSRLCTIINLKLFEIRRLRILNQFSRVSN